MGVLGGSCASRTWLTADTASNIYSSYYRRFRLHLPGDCNYCPCPCPIPSDAIQHGIFTAAQPHCSLRQAVRKPVSCFCRREESRLPPSEVFIARSFLSAHRFTLTVTRVARAPPLRLTCQAQGLITLCNIWRRCKGGHSTSPRAPPDAARFHGPREERCPPRGTLRDKH